MQYALNGAPSPTFWVCATGEPVDGERRHHPEARIADFDDSRIDAVTRDLARSLREEGVGAAMASQGDAGPGKKGDPVTIGAIVLAPTPDRRGGGHPAAGAEGLPGPQIHHAVRADPGGRPGKVSLDASWFNKAQMEETRRS